MTPTASLDIDLLAQTIKPGENALISPISIRIALAMLALGASGETREQLDRIAGDVDGADDGDGVLRIANSLWAAGSVQRGYVELVHSLFAAEARDLGNPSTGAERINAWIAKATDEQITELLSPNDIDELTVLALVNAITFRGSWAQAFDVERTDLQPFAAPAGAKDAWMMHRSGVIMRDRFASHVAVKLDYEGGYSLHAILPDEGSDPLTALREHRSSYGRAKADLSLPRFDLRCKSNLLTALTALGCERMFEAHGELDGVNSDPLLYVSKVVHEACMTTDEHGTVASAATAVIVRTRGRGPKTETITFDRPFAIKLTRGEQVLFAGAVCDPS